MTLVAGIDSSTRSCKVVVRDARNRRVGTARTRRVPERHGGAPNGTEVHPREWEAAPHAAVATAGGWYDVAAVSLGAQPHGMVCLDEAGEVVRPALLWNDTRSARAAPDRHACGRELA